MAQFHPERLWRYELVKTLAGCAAMQNKDENGIAHYPGWSLTALKYLYEERKITERS